MSWPPVRMTLWLRLPSTLASAMGMVAILIVVGALFPAVGHSIGRLNLPKGVVALLGGADYGSITGWYRSEIGSIYGPLVIGALAVTGAAATLAGEEEDRILALLLAHPIGRRRLVAAKAAAIAVLVIGLVVAVWVGMLSGVAIGGGGISIGHLLAFAVQLAGFGLAVGALTLALAAGTGRRALAAGVAAGVAIVGWLVNGFTPLVSFLSWLKYLTFFYYYSGHDPLTRGVDLPGLAVLIAFALLATALATVLIERRDLRA